MKGTLNPMKKRVQIIISVIIILLLISLTFFFQQPNSDNNENDQKSPSWTIIIYMSGDNHLDEMIPKNLGHMKSVGSFDDVNIVTLVDRKGSNNTELFYIETHDAKQFQLSELNPSYNNELNLGNKNTLLDFVNWSITNYPADNYLLDIWGHGKGWEGVAVDGNDYLIMPELDSSLKQIMEINNGNKLDIIGFDACNMGMLEVYCQIKDYADIAITSEKDIPERGWPYYDILMDITQNPNMSPKDFSKTIVDHYYNAYASGRLDPEDFSVQLAAIELNKIDDIIDNLEYFSTNRNIIESYERSDFKDLYHYAEINQLNDLMDTINKSIISEKHWSNPKGQKLNYCCGISIYYPNEYDDNYDKLKLSMDIEWDEGLKGVT
jgi:hypothetical protein